MEYPPQQPYPQPYQQPAYYPPYPPPPAPPPSRAKGWIDTRHAMTLFVAHTAALVSAGVILAVLFHIYLAVILSRGAEAFEKAEKERQQQFQKGQKPTP